MGRLSKVNLFCITLLVLVVASQCSGSQKYASYWGSGTALEKKATNLPQPRYQKLDIGKRTGSFIGSRLDNGNDTTSNDSETFTKAPSNSTRSVRYLSSYPYKTLNSTENANEPYQSSSRTSFSSISNKGPAKDSLRDENINEKEIFSLYDYSSSFYPDQDNVNYENSPGISFNNRYTPMNDMPISYQQYSSDLTTSEDKIKLITQTIAAGKALKFGKIVFLLIMLLVIVLLAGLGKAGVALSPIVLPLSLVPVGILALLLLLPILFIFMPFMLPEGAGKGWRQHSRKKRNLEVNQDLSLSVLEGIEKYLQRNKSH